MIDFHIPETVNAWVLGNPDELAPVAKRVRRPGPPETSDTQ